MAWKPRKLAHLWPRAEGDFYVEPVAATVALIGAEGLTGETWDPACGRGHVVEALRAAGRACIATDLVRRTEAEWFGGEMDFLSEQEPVFRPDNIVTNPPFGKGVLAEAFIRRALPIARAKVCVFVDSRFLGSAGRMRGLFAEHRPARIWWAAPRPSCPPGRLIEEGKKPGGGTSDFVWLVYERGHVGPATFDWLDLKPPAAAVQAEAA